jgi:hypothetical protein
MGRQGAERNMNVFKGLEKELTEINNRDVNRRIILTWIIFLGLKK